MWGLYRVKELGTSLDIKSLTTLIYHFRENINNISEYINYDLEKRYLQFHQCYLLDTFITILCILFL